MKTWVRAPIADLAPGERTLSGPVAHYLGRVLRLRAGSAFVGFDPVTALESDAVVVRADGDSVAARFGPMRAGGPRPHFEVAWIQGFAKADKCDAIVRDCTELGATSITIATTVRSVVKVDAARASARQARWARIAREAARQCGRNDVPLVGLPGTWTDALETTPESGSARFCLWERATEPLAPPLLEALDHDAALAFACGPEGGLDPSEVEVARTRGWRIVSLGPLILRTETVAAAVLGAVRIWMGLRASNS